MTVVLSVLIALAAVGALALLLWPVLRVYFKFKGTRVVTCPETHQAVAVEVDEKHAAVTAAGGHLHLRLRDCSRWPERRDCGQECLAQIEAAPMDCLLRTILARWYAGKVCAICRKPIPPFNWSDIDWLEFQPALLGPTGKTLGWSDFPPKSSRKRSQRIGRFAGTVTTSKAFAVASRSWWLIGRNISQLPHRGAAQERHS
jgi:hypothetical protein